MSREIVLRFRLNGRFGGFTLECEAEVPAGVTALVGASGSGKTTLLRCVAGLARAEGRVAVGDVVWQDEHQFLPPHQRGVGVVFQEPSLLAHLSVRQNLAFAARRAPAGEGLTLGETAEMLGLVGLLQRGTDSLSGGERQRVAIARALLSRPVLLLMDEPLSSLDASSKAEVMPYLEEIHRALRIPILYVSHDATEVARLADRVLQMRAGRLACARTSAPTPDDSHDPLALMNPGQVRALARAALAAGIEPPEAGEG
jgi:molybdate transport system ATP-binding protein